MFNPKFNAKNIPLGKEFETTCDHPGCNTKIHRGNIHACGGFPGSDEYTCDRYFCAPHQEFIMFPEGVRYMCEECASLLEYEEHDAQDYLENMGKQDTQ